MLMGEKASGIQTFQIVVSIKYKGFNDTKDFAVAVAMNIIRLSHSRSSLLSERGFSTDRRK